MYKLDITVKDVPLEKAQEIINKLSNINIGEAFSHHSAPAAIAVNAGGLPPVSAGVPNPPISLTSEFDSTGLPYDDRIHSSSKKKTAAGVWTRRKNIEDSFFNQVASELRAGGVAAESITQSFTPPAPVVVAPVQAAPVMPVVAPAVAEMNAPLPAFLQNMPNAAPVAPVVQAPVIIAPAPVVAPVVHTAPAVEVGKTIGDLFNKVQGGLQTGTIDANYINSLTSRLSTRHGVQVTSINDIANRPDIIADAFALMAADGK